MLDDVCGVCPALREVIVLELDWEAFLIEGLLTSDEALAEREASLQFDDPINIQYTSGTTGSPKGATLTHHNLVNNAHFTAMRLAYSALDRVCVPVPFYHCFGMVLGTLGCVSHGACIVVPSESFDPAAVLETVEAERCTSLLGVPTMFIAELEDPAFERFDLSSLRTGMMGGAPCPVEVMKQVRTQMHMDAGDDHLRHDRDLAGLDADDARRAAREARRDGRPRPPAPRDQARRSRDRRDRAARDARRAVHARLQRHARLLGRRGGHARAPSTRAAGCTAATSP